MTATEQKVTERKASQQKVGQLQQQNAGLDVDETTLEQPSIVDRILVNFGARRPAVQVRRSGWRAASEFYWFKCSRCHKITANYIHGFTGYLPCNHCEHETRKELSALRATKSSKTSVITFSPSL